MEDKKSPLLTVFLKGLSPRAVSGEKASRNKLSQKVLVASTQERSFSANVLT